MLRFYTNANKLKYPARHIILGTTKYAGGPNGESARMKQFHKKLESSSSKPSSVKYGDLILVDIDSKSGELKSNNEKEPTKWGDWQHGGRVTDF